MAKKTISYLTDGDDIWGGWENDVDYEVLGYSGHDQLYGYLGNDTLDGGDGNDQVYGGQGNDQLKGGNGKDKLDGGEGDDLLDGGEGDDTLFGYTGNDTLWGGAGNDLMFGFDGDDWMDGGIGDDTLYGENHQDTLYGSADNDSIDGGNGKDLLYGESGNDYLHGYNGVDELDGGADNDTLDGGNGDDLLIGGTGNDFLYGADGRDRLQGVGTTGVGSIDTLVGGAEADTFVLGDSTAVYYNGGDDALTEVYDYALIKDFNRLEDTIELHGSASDYIVGALPTELEPSFSNINATAIYLDTDSNQTWNETDEMIAVVEHLVPSGLVLDANYFEYSDPSSADFWHPESDSNWELVFNDEFDGTTLDLTKWNTRYAHNHYGGRTNLWNHEWQYYVGDDESIDGVLHDAFEFDNGTLSIVGKKAEQPITAEIGDPLEGFADVKEFEYTSGLLSTHNKYAFTNGYVEIRAKVPAGQGLWPAFWMLPTSGEWPPEIDIMEVLGHKTDTVYNTVHYKDDLLNQGQYQGEQVFNGVDFADDFHTFAAKWNSDRLTWFIDDQAVFDVENNIPEVPMYLIVNLAIGGTWPGAPDNTTPLASSFDIDYIRVYQDASGTLHQGAIA